ncbi:MAG TPA: Uma2 family endonuclease [Bryobacteraceae bacterium]|nr:Uma2 family endonuclease [Bryobacteraceae bacterium]
MSSQPVTRVSPEEYLELERAAETKHEWIEGEIVAMAGGSLAHALITGNLCRELGSRLLGRCLVFSPDARVCVDWQRMITYPDVTVLCGSPQYVDEKHDTITNPTLIAEVLSPSTQIFDRGQKSWLYRQLPSLSEYLLVSQEAVNVERYSRLPDGDWKIETVRDIEGVIKLASLGCELPLRLIYHGVDTLS